MFYLKTYFRAAKYFPISHGIHVVGIALILLSCAYVQEGRPLLKQIFVDGTEPHFTVVYRGKRPFKDIGENFKKLPGIIDIEVLSEQEVNSIQSTFLTSISPELTDLVSLKDPSVFKVFLSPELSSRTRDLITEYVGQFLGEQNAIIGKVNASRVGDLQERIFSLAPIAFPFFVFFVSVLPFTLRVYRQQLKLRPFRRRPYTFVWGHCLFLCIVAGSLFSVGQLLAPFHLIFFLIATISLLFFNFVVAKAHGGKAHG